MLAKGQDDHYIVLPKSCVWEFESAADTTYHKVDLLKWRMQLCTPECNEGQELP